jgi:hypothetical protein
VHILGIATGLILGVVRVEVGTLGLQNAKGTMFAEQNVVGAAAVAARLVTDPLRVE